MILIVTAFISTITQAMPTTQLPTSRGELVQYLRSPGPKSRQDEMRLWGYHSILLEAKTFKLYMNTNLLMLLHLMLGEMNF